MVQSTLKPLVDKLDDSCREALEEAVRFSHSLGSTTVHLEHWLLKLIGPLETDLGPFLLSCRVDPPRLVRDLVEVVNGFTTGHAGLAAVAPEIVAALHEAWSAAAVRFKATRVRPGHVLYALLAVEWLGERLRRASAEFEKISVDRLAETLSFQVAWVNELLTFTRPPRSPAPELLEARTNEEAHLYMDLHPCRCGDSEFDRKNRVVYHGDDLVSVYDGTCTGCGAKRVFEFRLPDTLIPPTRPLSYGATEPSTIICPGQFLAVADERAKRSPASLSGLDATARARATRDMEVAHAAVAEVLKSVPEGAREVPPSAFFTELGRRVYEVEPGRFHKLRLEAVLAAYKNVLNEYAASSLRGRSAETSRPQA